MVPSFAVLGFRNSDGSLGFALTSRPLTYVDRLRTGDYATRWIDRDAKLSWVVPARDHSEAQALRDRWNEAPASLAVAEADELSVPTHVIDELNELGGDELAAELLGEETGSEAIRAFELIGQYGKFTNESRPIAVINHEPPHASPFIPLPKGVKPLAQLNVSRTDLGLKLAIFDLDGTLVNSSSLEGSRASRDWPDVLRRIEEVRPLSCWSGCSPHRLPELLNRLGVRVALISRANRAYVQAVVDRFGIEADWICAPSGRDKIEAFGKALRYFDASPSRTVVFGDDASDFRAAAYYGILSLGNPWTFKSNAAVAPDVAWLDASLLLEGGDWRKRLPYIGEIDPDDATWHRGSLLTYGDDAYTLGRYFTKLRDEHRHLNHRLSRGILAGKKDPNGDPYIRSAFAVAVHQLAERVELDAVISVPPYADQDDRFVPFRQLVQDATGARNIVSRQPPYRVGRGRFKVDDDLNGSTVLLIDDVVTKGGTLGELRKAAEVANAGRIIQIAFGFTQNLQA